MASITAWAKKVWKDRKTEYPTRRTLTKTDGSQEIVTVERKEGNVSQEGDAFSAANMNDLEERIDAGFADVTRKLSHNKIRIATIKHTVNSSGNLSEVSTYDYDASGIIRTSNYGYIGTNGVIKTAYTYPNYTYYAEVPIIINSALFNKGDVIATKSYNVEYNMLGYY